jgi:glycosyltransferase involved in cell wall biosynthesis
VPLVVAVGRLVPVKRLDLLVDALVRLRRQVPDLTAVLAGEGYEMPRLRALVAQADAADWLQLPGKLHESELLDLYRRAWVVASASSHEGWGMTITEAAACGTPAVATRIPGHADAIDDGVTGRLVEGADDMVEALRSLLTDPDLRRRMGEAARRRAAGLTWDATARGTLAVLAAEATRRRRTPS